MSVGVAKFILVGVVLEDIVLPHLPSCVATLVLLTIRCPLQALEFRGEEKKL